MQNQLITIKITSDIVYVDNETKRKQNKSQNVLTSRETSQLKGMLV